MERLIFSWRYSKSNDKLTTAVDGTSLTLIIHYVSPAESEVRPGRLLTWCQKQTQGYRGVDVTNLTSSWKNGLALCALMHRQRPEIM